MEEKIFQYPNISETAFSINLLGFNLNIQWYGLSYIAGILLAWLLMAKLVQNKDLWFTGMTTKHVVTAYVGYDVPAQVSSRATGGGVAAPIVQEIFASLYPEGQEPEEFKAPEGIRFEQITSTDGLAAKSGRGSLSEAFKEGEGPNTSVAPTATGEQVEDGANRFSGTGGLY